MAHTFFLLGTLFAGLGVAAGAFGAHSLKEILAPNMLAVFETAVRYQMLHALVLFVVGGAVVASPIVWFRVAGWTFVAGIALFSGSLYMLTFTGTPWYGALTPLGGVSLLLGWMFLGWGFWKHRQTRNVTMPKG